MKAVQSLAEEEAVTVMRKPGHFTSTTCVSKPPRPAPTENTVPKQLTPWKPGQSGNPAGRPKGSRNRLSEDFIRAFAEDFEVHAIIPASAPDFFTEDTPTA